MKIKSAFIYGLLFVFTLVFFVFFTFPYTVLKEAIVNQAERQTGYVIHIKKLEPSLPLGLELEGVKVSLNSGKASFELKEVEIDLSLFWLLLGRISVDFDITSKPHGWLAGEVQLGVLDMLSGGAVLPRVVFVEAKNFVVAPIINLALRSMEAGLARQPMVVDLLSKLSVAGLLSGKIDVDLDSGKLSQAQGAVDLKLQQAMLKLNESLGIPNQNFSKAFIKAQLKPGSLTVDKKSGFHTQGLQVDLQGRAGLKDPYDRSKLDVDLDIKLEQDLKQQFGYIIDNLLGGAGGSLSYKLKGTLGKPSLVAQ